MTVHPNLIASGPARLSIANRLVVNVHIAFQYGVDRREIVGAVNLDAVAGSVDHRHVRLAGLVHEVTQHAAHVVYLQVATNLDIVEAGRRERFRNQRGLMGWIWKPSPSRSSSCR